MLSRRGKIAVPTVGQLDREGRIQWTAVLDGEPDFDEHFTWNGCDPHVANANRLQDEVFCGRSTREFDLITMPNGETREQMFELMHGLSDRMIAGDTSRQSERPAWEKRPCFRI